MSTLIHELRYAIRVLNKNRGYALIGLLTLTLGIAANITVFSATNAFLRRLMEVPEARFLVRLYGGEDGVDIFSYPNYLDLKERVRSLTDLAAHAFSGVSLSDGKSQPQNVTAELVTGNFFAILRVSPAMGRWISSEDNQILGGSPVVVISHELWQRHFKNDPEAVGKKLYLNGHLFTIVGVMPPGFTGSQAVQTADLWTPLMMYEEVRPRDSQITNRGWGWLKGIGRLKPEVSLEQAQTEVNHVAAQLQREHAGPENEALAFRLWKARAVPEQWSQGLSKPLQLLTVVVIFVLLVVSANIASLLLSRVISHRQEIAIRKSLGASQFSLVRQCIIESLLLAFISGVAGLLLSEWLRDVLQWWVPANWAGFVPVLQADKTVLAFTVAICFLTGLLCGIIPAIKLNEIGIASLLREKAGGHPSRLFGGLIIGQVCLSFLLIVLASLFLRSLQRSSSFDVGFNTKNLVLAGIDLSRNKYEEQKGRQFYEDLLVRARSVPGVESATLAWVAPLEGSEESQGYRIEGYRSESGGSVIPIANNRVGSNYFTTMKIPVLRGRGFDERDEKPGAKSVAVINETLARKFWSLEEAIGKTIREADGPAFEIIGIAKDIKYYALGEKPMPYVYISTGQAYSPNLTLHVRTHADPAGIMDALKREIVRIDPKVAISHLTTFSELRKLQLFPVRALSALCSFFGGLTLLLTGLGIYGTLSYSVNQRVHEIGIRMALGAQAKDVFRLFLTRGFWLIAIGIGGGCFLALWLTRFLTGLLFQVNATDPMSFAGTAMILTATAMLACSIPCYRAIRINPMEALRHE